MVNPWKAFARFRELRKIRTTWIEIVNRGKACSDRWDAKVIHLDSYHRVTYPRKDQKKYCLTAWGQSTECDIWDDITCDHDRQAIEQLFTALVDKYGFEERSGSDVNRRIIEMSSYNTADELVWDTYDKWVTTVLGQLFYKEVLVAKNMQPKLSWVWSKVIVPIVSGIASYYLSKK